jgi:hypothetical protein
MPDNNIFFALSNASEGKDAAFNEWYDTYHIREVPALMKGFLVGRRFRLADVQPAVEAAGIPSPWRYLAIYQLDPSMDVGAIHAGVHEPHDTTKAGDALSPDHVAWSWEPVGSRVVANTLSATPGAQQHVVLALTNPALGREDEFNAWYDEHRVHEILDNVAGCVAAQRYQLTDAQREEQWLAAVPGRMEGSSERRPDQWLPWKYLALYELEGDVGEVRDAYAQMVADGALTPPGDLADADFGLWLFTALPDPSWRVAEPRTATGAPVPVA